MARNFRSAYYKSLGVRANESNDAQIKQLFDELLQKSVVSKVKLKSIVLRCGVYREFRPVVWKLALDILPEQQCLWDFVQQEKECMFNDLADLLAVVSLDRAGRDHRLVVPPRIGSSRTSRIRSIWLLYCENVIPFDSVCTVFLQREYSAVLQNIAEAITDGLESDSDAFWCFSAVLMFLTQTPDTSWKAWEITPPKIQDIERLIFG